MNHKSSCKKKQFRCIGLYEIQISIIRCTFFLTFIGTDQAFEMWSRWDQGKQRNKDPYTPPPPKLKVFCFLFNKGICLYTLLYVFVYLSVDYRSMKKGILCIGPYSGRNVYKILLCTHTNT